jgi:SAM-dependent methyltransferase
VEEGLKDKAPDEIFAYYRSQVEENEDYVGYGEATLKRVIVSAAARLGGTEIVDLGCGPNPVVLFDLHARKPDMRFTGVELSSQFADAAERNAAKRNVPFHRVNTSVHETGLPASSFAGAILSETLEHIPDEYENAVLVEAHRILKPGGWLIASVPNSRSAFDRYMTWRRGHRHEHPQHLREYTPNRLRRLLVANGFAIERGLRVPPPVDGGRVARLLAPVPAGWSLKAAFVARSR